VTNRAGGGFLPGVRGTSLIRRLGCRNPRRGRLVFGIAIDELIRCEEGDADLCSTAFGQVTRQFRIAIVVHVPRAIRWRCVQVGAAPKAANVFRGPFPAFFRRHLTRSGNASGGIPGALNPHGTGRQMLQRYPLFRSDGPDAPSLESRLLKGSQQGNRTL
jgi:hypothetical protein